MRLTTDNPKGNMESARNLFYIKDGETWVLGGGPEPDYKDVTLHDFIRRLTKIHDLNINTDDNEAMGDQLYDLLLDNVDSIEGVVALLYTAAWSFSELREKLKAYEDTGLEPEEIISGEELAEIASTLLQLLQYQALGTIEELSALVKAQDEGRAVVLPVPKGTTVYRVLHYSEHKCQGRMKGRTVAASTRIHKGVMQWEDAPNWGKTVFLTRAEAEAALSGGKGNV